MNPFFLDAQVGSPDERFDVFAVLNDEEHSPRGDAVEVGVGACGLGVNDFTIEEQPPEILYIDETVRQRQSAKLKALRERRSNEEVRRRLDALKRAAAQEPQVRADGKISDANTMPYIVDAVRAYATVGEICAPIQLA